MIVPSTSLQATIKALRPIFATHGLPEIVVPDNGSAFTSEEFQEFVTCSVQSVEQITAHFHQISDAGRMAVQLAVKHYFGEDVMVSSSVVLVNYNFN